MASVVLVRYGTIPEVSCFRAELELDRLARGARVVVKSHRGLQLGTVLGEVLAVPVNRVSAEPQGPETPTAESDGAVPPIVRLAADADLETEQQLRDDSAAAFHVWRNRIEQWQLELELIDLEWTIDRQKLILYVLNRRGPDCTKLALQAAAAGLGIIEVQPVAADGLLAVADVSHGGGCGTCGCH